MHWRSSVCIAAFAFAAAVQAAVTFGPERAISPIENTPPLGGQFPEGIASDGNGFLAVWHDEANGRDGIWAAPISASGEIHPESQILIQRGGGVSGTSPVAWNGEAYVVFWTEFPDYTLMMARLSRDGQVLEAPRKLLHHAIPRQSASNGTNVLLAYQDVSETSKLRALVVDRGSNVVGDSLIAPLADMPVAAASDGDSFVVVWRDFNKPPIGRVVATQLTSTGARVMERELFSANNPLPSALAYGAGTYELIVRTSDQLLAVPINAAALDPRPAVQLDFTGYASSAVFNGSAFVTLWESRSSLRTAVIDARSEATPPMFAPDVSPYLSGPIFAWNGHNFFAIWADYRRGQTADLFGALLDGGVRSAITAAAPVAFAPVTQEQPMLATSGFESFALWTEQLVDGLRARLVASRIDAYGNIGAPLTLAEDAYALGQPQIVFTGSAYLAVWQIVTTVGELEIDARLMERDGTAGPLLHFGGGRLPVIASNGTVMLLAFARDGDITAIRLSDRGVSIDATPLIVAARSPSELSVASNGTDFLVGWSEGSDYWQFPPPNLLEIYGARVMSNGSVDATPIAIATGRTNQFSPAVASDGRDFIVVYQLGGSFMFRTDGQIAVKRVLREGQIAGLAEVDGAVIGSGRNPRIARHANGSFVAFHDAGANYFAELDATGERRGLVTLPADGASGAATIPFGNGALWFYTRMASATATGPARRAFLRIGTLPTSRTRSARH